MDDLVPGSWAYRKPKSSFAYLSGRHLHGQAPRLTEMANQPLLFWFEDRSGIHPGGFDRRLGCTPSKPLWAWHGSVSHHSQMRRLNGYVSSICWADHFFVSFTDRSFHARRSARQTNTWRCQISNVSLLPLPCAMASAVTATWL